jgi:hypothetical protein
MLSVISSHWHGTLGRLRPRGDQGVNPAPLQKAMSFCISIASSRCEGRDRRASASTAASTLLMMTWPSFISPIVTATSRIRPHNFINSSVLFVGRLQTLVASACCCYCTGSVMQTSVYLPVSRLSFLVSLGSSSFASSATTSAWRTARLSEVTLSTPLLTDPGQRRMIGRCLVK